MPFQFNSISISRIFLSHFIVKKNEKKENMEIALSCLCLTQIRLGIFVLPFCSCFRRRAEQRKNDRTNFVFCCAANERALSFRIFYCIVCQLFS